MRAAIGILALTIYFLESLVSEPIIAIRLVESTSDLDMHLFIAARDALAEESRFTHPIDIPKPTEGVR